VENVVGASPGLGCSDVLWRFNAYHIADNNDEWDIHIGQITDDNATLFHRSRWIANQTVEL